MIKLIRYTIYGLVIATILVGCGDVKKGISGKKLNKGEEFLIDKKNPLVLPPEFSELPVPKNSTQTEMISEDTEEDIKKLLDINNTSSEKNSKSNNNGSSEQSILKKIK